jgi:archaellum component FlaC
MDHETAEDIKRHFDVVANRLRSELGEQITGVANGLRSELGEQIAGVRAELGTEILDVKRHSDVIAESLRSEIRLVAEGVAGLDEKFTKEFVEVREEIREQIGEVKSLIGTSYSDLDRRVQTLERKPS